MPKRSCTDRAKWVLLRGKPAKPLSAHYQLDCDYGTPVLTIYREGEGDTPTYLCEVHAAAERDAATAARPLPRPIGQGISVGVLDPGVMASADRTGPVSNPAVAQLVEQSAQRPVQHDGRIPTAEIVVAKRSPHARKPNAPAAKSSALPPKSSAPPLTPVARAVASTPSSAMPNVPVAKRMAPVSIEAVPEPASPAAKIPPPLKVNSAPKGSPRDLTYGNPAKALVDETIWNLQPGDYDTYRTALQEGKSVFEAAQAAGGQLAVVHRKIQEYTARIDALLSASNAAINVDDAIQGVLEAETLKIIADNAITDDQKDVALARLGEFQEWVNRGLKPAATPPKAHKIALAIADRANWGGACDTVPNELRSVYRALYTTLRDAIHSAIADMHDPDERLANLHAAKCELQSVCSTPTSAPDAAVPSGLNSAPEEKFAQT
ncbi:MAG: hypothetical protein ACRD8A_10395 [Candidatus Acidiferrales bacterium]